MVRRTGFDVSAKISEIIEAAEKQVIRTAVETLLQKGTTIKAENLKIDVTDLQGKPIFRVEITGKIDITVPS